MLLPLLVEPKTLLPLLGHPDLLILDVCQSDNYRKHHIPGAVHIHPAELQCGVPPAAGRLPDKTSLATLFSRVGLHHDKHVVVYDDEGGGWAGRLIWTLDVIGHGKSSYLNGGLHSWAHSDAPLESVPNSGEASVFVIGEFESTVIAETEDIIKHLHNPDFLIWDARSAEEFNGQRQTAMRNGHIPGAINIDWLNLMDRHNHLRLLDLNQLQYMLDKAGLTADKTIITHCHSHHRSGLSYLVMKLLGYPHIKAYHGSWGEWGNREDTPVEI